MGGRARGRGGRGAVFGRCGGGRGGGRGGKHHGALVGGGGTNGTTTKIQVWGRHVAVVLPEAWLIGGSHVASPPVRH